MKKYRVFLVDDHPLIREVLRQQLIEDGDVEVVGEFGSAEEALEQMGFLLPDVVVLDINLPGMNGLEATRRIKIARGAIRVIVLSGYGPEYARPSLQAGADGYLLKTLPAEKLIDELKKAIRGTSSTGGPLAPNSTEKTWEAGSARLSPRQLDLLRMAAEGYSSKEMAARTLISEATLKREFQHIFDVLGVNNRTLAVAEAYRRKLI